MPLFKDDWKRRIDRAEKQLQKRLQEEQEKAKREQKLREMEEHKKFSERRKQEYEERLREHQQRFSCHVCGKPSQGPAEVSVYEPLSLEPGMPYDRYVGTTTDWNSPTGLSKCSKCGKWVCEKHIYKGICRQCAYEI
jgi:DNA repair exonuclease SbcCD ATPase subunit